MQPPQKGPILQLQCPVRHLIPAFGECHNFLLHPILEPQNQIHDRLGIRL